MTGDPSAPGNLKNQAYNTNMNRGNKNITSDKHPYEVYTTLRLAAGECGKAGAEAIPAVLGTGQGMRSPGGMQSTW